MLINFDWKTVLKYFVAWGYHENLFENVGMVCMKALCGN